MRFAFECLIDNALSIMAEVGQKAQEIMNY